MKRFQFTTIFNKPWEYTRLRASLAAAGFGEEECDFLGFDNSRGNQCEPYSAFARAGRESCARWLVHCHQDILLDRGHGRDRLIAVLEELDDLRPGWAVAGVAGVNAAHEIVARIHDLSPTLWWDGTLPQSVVLLDEVFFVVNGADNARWSPELAGFHCYGMDVCFHGLARGRSVHVIDFHITHTGAGRIAPHLHEQHLALEQRWSRGARFCLGRSMMGLPLVLTDSIPLRRVFSHPAIKARLMRPRWRWVWSRVLPKISGRHLLP